MKSVLVTGGAGYIGSHTVALLLKQGYQPVVVDNLVNGFRESLIGDVAFYNFDVRNKASLARVFKKHNISAVIHLAGLAIIEESFKKPHEYLDNNLNGTISVLEQCREFGVKDFIFSSSSTIYGDAEAVGARAENSSIEGARKITEKHNNSVMSPYGQTKLLCEEKIQEFANECDLNFLILRYFNVAGASAELTNGPRGNGSDRLIFNATKAAVYGSGFKINGNDYATSDGTCVRDYIHVEDIADIHVLGLKHLNSCSEQKNICREILNCGYGRGFSVLEIVENFKKLNKVEFKVETGARRPGDPAYLVGDNSELVKLLNWKSRFINPLEAICKSAYLWEKCQG